MPEPKFVRECAKASVYMETRDATHMCGCYQGLRFGSDACPFPENYKEVIVCQCGGENVVEHEDGHLMCRDCGILWHPNDKMKGEPIGTDERKD